MTSVNQTQRTV